MAREDVLRALQSMNDPAVCERLAAADFSALPGLTLEEQERKLERDAAADYPDVSGSASEAFLKLPGLPLEFPAEVWSAITYGWSN